MTDFPRGWTLQSIVGPAATASIIVPATAGVVHVLDSLAASFIASAAAAVAAVAFVQINTGAGLLTYMELVSNGGVVSRDSDSLSGLDLATAPGAALTVTFSGAAPANYAQLIVIQGHDI